MNPSTEQLFPVPDVIAQCKNLCWSNHTGKNLDQESLQQTVGS